MNSTTRFFTILLLIFCCSSFVQAMNEKNNEKNEKNIVEKKYKISTLYTQGILPTLGQQAYLFDNYMRNYSHWCQTTLSLDLKGTDELNKILFERIELGGTAYLEILNKSIKKPDSHVDWLKNFSALIYFFLAQGMHKTLDSEGPKNGWSCVVKGKDLYDYLVTAYGDKVSYHEDFIEEAEQIHHLCSLHEKAYIITINPEVKSKLTFERLLYPLPYNHTILLVIYDSKHQQTFLRTGEETNLWRKKDRENYTNKLKAVGGYVAKIFIGKEHYYDNTCTKKEYLTQQDIHDASYILGVKLDDTTHLSEIYEKLNAKLKPSDTKKDEPFLLKFYKPLYEKQQSLKILDDCSSSESLELYIQKLLSSYDYLTTRYGNEIVCSPIELTLTAWPYKYRVQLRHLIHETTKGKESPDAEITDEKELRHTMETLYKIVNYFKKLQRLIFLHNNNKTNEKYPLQKIRSVAKEIIELNLLKILKRL